MSSECGSKQAVPHLFDIYVENAGTESNAQDRGAHTGQTGTHHFHQCLGTENFSRKNRCGELYTGSTQKHSIEKQQRPGSKR